jgi:hypothetical protein
MKRIIILAMALVMMLVSISGCWPWSYEDDRGAVPGGPENSQGPRGHTGPRGAGGGH